MLLKKSKSCNRVLIGIIIFGFFLLGLGLIMNQMFNGIHLAALTACLVNIGILLSHLRAKGAFGRWLRFLAFFWLGTLFIFGLAGTISHIRLDLSWWQPLIFTLLTGSSLWPLTASGKQAIPLPE